MKPQSKLINKCGGLTIAAVSQAWMSTLDYRAACYDWTADPAHPDFTGPAIYVMWHEYIPFVFYMRGYCNIAALMSRHQDAEWLSQAGRLMGFRTVRGSTSRGGVAALRELWRQSRHMNLAITPDGPRGPRRRLASGCVYLSSRLQIPLVAIGVGYDRPWRTPTWDRFAVPRPYSRARAIVSPFLHIPSDLDREALERYRVRVERLLNRTTEQAERWAEAGGSLRWLQERALRREGTPLSAKRRRRLESLEASPEFTVVPSRRCA